MTLHHNRTDTGLSSLQVCLSFSSRILHALKIYKGGHSMSINFSAKQSRHSGQTTNCQTGHAHKD